MREIIAAIVMTAFLCTLVWYIYERKVFHKGQIEKDVKCIVVDKGSNIGTRNDIAITNKVFLIRRLDDTTLYREIRVPDSTFYNKRLGDTVHFVYIRKDFFWKKY